MYPLEFVVGWPNAGDDKKTLYYKYVGTIEATAPQNPNQEINIDNNKETSIKEDKEDILRQSRTNLVLFKQKAQEILFNENEPSIWISFIKVFNEVYETVQYVETEEEARLNVANALQKLENCLKKLGNVQHNN